jgi:predicted DCC family thiol-disulfide oxidoreductase YuxK
MDMNTLTQSTSEPKHETLTSVDRPLLVFFDGECGFCNHWINRVRNADHAHRIRYGTKQGKTFQEVAKAHPEVANVESIVVISRNGLGHEDILVRTPAVRTIVEGLPDFRFFAFLLQVIPTPICNLGYLIFSRLRGSLTLGKFSSCRVSTQQERELFVD